MTAADGKTRDLWERNLRFKTDVSEDGPQKGAPAIVAAGHDGRPDRCDLHCTRRNQRSYLTAMLIGAKLINPRQKENGSTIF